MKKIHYEHKQKSVANALNESNDDDIDIESSVLSIDANGIGLVVGKKDILAISKALHELDAIANDTCMGKWTDVKGHKKPDAKPINDSELSESTDDLTNIFSHLTVDE